MIANILEIKRLSGPEKAHLQAIEALSDELKTTIKKQLFTEKVTHGDIKLQNILVDDSKGRATIIDVEDVKPGDPVADLATFSLNLGNKSTEEAYNLLCEYNALGIARPQPTDKNRLLCWVPYRRLYFYLYDFRFGLLNSAKEKDILEILHREINALDTLFTDDFTDMLKGDAHA